MFYYKQFLF